MIYLFYGNNTEENRRKCDMFLQKLFVKKPNASFFEYDSENFNTRDIEELAQGQGLFEREYIIVLSGALAVAETKDYILERLKILAESPHVFIFIEEKVEAAFVKQFITHAKKIWKSEKNKAQRADFNPFALGDALAARDRKKAWVLFCKSVDVEGLKPEQILGTLFSQVKNLLLVKRGEGENPGLHPFVFQKIKRCVKNYSIEELENLSASLVELYHNARRGACDMRVALELLILRI
ncbi:MAG: hypothetical protein HYT27_00785 [Parcubacteria group bacterium]|nr:hypothetical protein [Parcubacteria group bacterium]